MRQCWNCLCRGAAFCLSTAAATCRERARQWLRSTASVCGRITPRFTPAVLALLLTACGGGDPDDDHAPPPDLPDCAARPELCK